MHASKPEHKNRRRSIRPRPEGATKVTCRKGSSGLGASLAVRLLDLSEVGIRLLIKESLQIGQEVSFELLGLTQSRPVKIAARVVWCLAAADGTWCLGAQFDKGLRYADFQQMV